MLYFMFVYVFHIIAFVLCNTFHGKLTDANSGALQQGDCIDKWLYMINELPVEKCVNGVVVLVVVVWLCPLHSTKISLGVREPLLAII